MIILVRFLAFWKTHKVHNHNSLFPYFLWFSHFPQYQNVSLYRGFQIALMSKSMVLKRWAFWSILASTAAKFCHRVDINPLSSEISLSSIFYRHYGHPKNATLLKCNDWEMDGPRESWAFEKETLCIWNGTELIQRVSCVSLINDACRLISMEQCQIRDT